MDFLRQYGDLFGLRDAARQLVVTKSASDALGHRHTTYRQVHNGVPVFSGVLKVHQDAASNVIAANGHFHPIPLNLNTNPSMSADAGLAVAKSQVTLGKRNVEKSELIIVDPGWYGDRSVGAHLAYYFILTDLSVPFRTAFFIDAHNGDVLDQWSVLYSARVRAIHNGNGFSTLPGTLARSEDGPPVGSSADVDRAYDYLGDAYDFFNRAFGRDGINGTGMTIVATTNSSAPSPCPNAFWQNTQMAFCLGTAADDVSAHELTHGITQFTAGLIYQNQSGMLNESFSDIFGELVDLYNGDAAFAGTPGGPPFWPVHPTGPGTDTPNALRASACDGVRWLVGEDASALGGAIRDMWNPPCFGDPDRALSSLLVCDPTDNGGVHTGSGVANHAFAIMTDGRTFNGQTVAPIGAIKAGAVWYRALTTYLTPGSGFMDAYDALNQAADDLIGTTPNDPRTGDPSGSTFTTADAAEVDRALLAVEMNTPGLCGTPGGGPSGDYGDAPVGDVGDGINAYPGITGHFASFFMHKNTVLAPTQHAHGTWVDPGATFFLGVLPPNFEGDTRQEPDAPENDSNPLIVLEALGTNPLATLIVTVSADATHNPDLPVYLNIAIDQNRDGQYKDRRFFGTFLFASNLEWVVQDLELRLTPTQRTEVAVSGLRLEKPTSSHWIRVLITNKPVGAMYRPPNDFWDFTMPSRGEFSVVGEVEDFLLEFYSDPSQAPNDGERPGPAIILREDIENDGQNNKPSCFLRMIFIENSRRGLFDIRPFHFQADWCPGDRDGDGFNDGNGTDVGFRYKSISFNGGCSLPGAVGQVSIYGMKHLRGVVSPPKLTRNGNFPAPEGGRALKPVRGMTCPAPLAALPAIPGNLSDNPNRPDPERAHLDNIILPVGVLTGPPPPIALGWNFCYQKTFRGRWRLYTYFHKVRSCGCEIQNYSVVPPPEIPADLTTVDRVGQGQPTEAWNGRLIEEFVDPPADEVFPDRRFADWNSVLLDPMFGVAELSTEEFFFPPSSFKLQSGKYVVRPNIPTPDIIRATEVTFRYLCEPFRVILRSTNGQTIEEFLDFVSCTEWALKSIKPPLGFDLEEIEIEMFDGYIDEIFVELGPRSEPADCNGNAVDDSLEITNGEIADCNTNGIPDDCDVSEGTSEDTDGNGVPDECDSQPRGACCFANGACLVTTQESCVLVGDGYLGDGTICQGDGDGNNIDDACEVVFLQACCLDDGTCIDTTVEECDVPHGGNPQGPGTTCAAAMCPAKEACCAIQFSGHDGCAPEFPDQCLAIVSITGAHGIPQGAGTECATEGQFNVPVREPCCFPDGSCVAEIQPPCCEGLGGVIVSACLGDQDGDGFDDACDVRGACCDRTGDVCQDNVLPDNCASPLEWSAGALCANLNPPCGATCVTNEDCATAPEATACTFDSCESGACTFAPNIFGDVAGPAGACGPDGDVALIDILALLDGFAGVFRAPCTHGNLDICGPAGSCVPDGVIGLSDILCVLDAFQGIDPCCSVTDGACCTSGACSDGVTQAQCNGGGGDYQGDGTDCASVQCPVGACCVGNLCTEGMAEVDCITAGGDYQGDGSVCNSAVVYSNVNDPITSYFPPGIGNLVADDLDLAGADGCALQAYELVVFGGPTPGGTFDVHVALWDGDPCDPGSDPIPGTAADFFDVPDDGSFFLLTANLNTSVSIPGTVWMNAVFSTDEAGWMIAEQAEIGSTADSFAYDDPMQGCDLFTFTDPGPWAGFWATVVCEGCASSSVAAAIGGIGSPTDRWPQGKSILSNGETAWSVDVGTTPDARTQMRKLPGHPRSRRIGAPTGPAATVVQASTASPRRGKNDSPNHARRASAVSLTLAPSQSTVRAGEAMDVDVYVDGALDLRSYEISVEATGGLHGKLELIDVSIDTTRSDYLLQGVEHVTAVDATTGRLAAAAYTGGVPVSDDAYVGTFTFRASSDAAGLFRFNVRSADTTVLDSAAVPMAVESASTSISVGPSTDGRVGSKPIRRGRR